MKVYVLSYDWAIDGESGAETIGVYADRKSAEQAMTKQVELIKNEHSISHLDREEYVESDYFDLYQEGFYCQEHEHLVITEHEIA